jgi:predicted hydrocarbon binding protein
MTEQRKPKLVRCPEPFEPLFVAAEDAMAQFFTNLERRPEEGEITISGVRYLLVRAASMSIQFRHELASIYGLRTANQIIYNFGRACGIQDARLFAERLNLTDPATRLAAGPVHFAHVGWAFVDIFPESAPSPDENYFLIYDHPFSFEANSYIEAGITSEEPVCFMNAGYSSGWCEVSFGVELGAREITCRARGDEQCIFIMAPPQKLLAYTREYKARYGVS